MSLQMASRWLRQYFSDSAAKLIVLKIVVMLPSFYLPETKCLPFIGGYSSTVLINSIVHTINIILIIMVYNFNDTPVKHASESNT